MAAKPRRPKIELVAPATSVATGLEHLSVASRAWVEGVEAGWSVDEHHRRLLLVAAQAWDLAEQMRELLDAEGYVYYVQRLGNYRPRPEAQIMHDAQLRMLRALRDLGLDDAPVPMGPLALRHGNRRS